jgi:predicted RNase H-like HicB family nuclease
MRKSLKDYLYYQYDTVVVPDECMDGAVCYRAEHPQLSGCMSHGKTPEEALRNLGEAKRLYIQTLLDEGLDVPIPPQTTSTTYSSYQLITIITSPIEKDEKIIFDLHQVENAA